MPQVRGIRRLGSAAIDICYVAAGYLDAYWEMNLHRWDVAAASLIAREAGALVSSYRQDREISILASAPALHARLLTTLKNL
jgi:myo-inositol-1(or 4)-monophosphatase